MSSPAKGKYEVLEPGGTFKNKGYKEWVQDWSNWFYQSNPDRNNNGDVVFLRSIPLSEGVYKKEPNVMVGDDSLVISDNQRVLVPIITANSVSFNTERPEIMYGYVRSHILNGDNPPLLSQLKINGEQIESEKLTEDFRQYEIETPVFQIAIPDDTEGESLKDRGDNAVDSTGLFPAVTRGYFILLHLIPDEDQQDYYIECSASGCTTDEGPYTASLFYHIIVNKSAPEKSLKGIREDVSPHDRPNRNIQILVETKMANNELGDNEYLEIMEKLKIQAIDQKFRAKVMENRAKVMENRETKDT